MTAVAQSDLAVRVAKEWFPRAAEDYAGKHPDQFAQDGVTCFDRDSFFERVMDTWHDEHEVADRKAFDDQVWQTIDDRVFAGAEEAIRDFAAEHHTSQRYCL